MARRHRYKKASASFTGPQDQIPQKLTDSIVTTKAQDRIWEFFEREQKPGETKATLAAAIQGDLHYQSRLFAAMIDSWPKLQRNIAEVARDVSTMPWEVEAWAPRGEEPDDAAQELASEIESVIWAMKPSPARFEDGLEDTIKKLAFGYYAGHAVSEILWEMEGGEWRPRATKPLPARFFKYPSQNPSVQDPEDRLMFDPAGQIGNGFNLMDFPENRFLIGVNTGHASHPAIAAPLRALVPYWLAAVYGLKWLMQFSQLYGLPFLHATIADAADSRAVEQALTEAGSRRYLLTKEGASVNAISDGRAGNQLPQSHLMEMADKQCDVFILGQTLTSGTDSSGSRALGEVHESTRDKMVAAVADFVGGVLTHQLVPSYIRVNYGRELENMPSIWPRPEPVKDTIGMANRDKILFGELGIEVGTAYLRDRHGIPAPQDGEEIFTPRPNTPPPGETPPPVIAAKVEAKAQDDPAPPDDIVSELMENITGVAAEWLAPVRPVFQRLAALTQSDRVSDEDFIEALEKANEEMPGLFEKLNTNALRKACEAALRAATADGLSEE